MGFALQKKPTYIVKIYDLYQALLITSTPHKRKSICQMKTVHPIVWFTFEYNLLYLTYVDMVLCTLLLLLVEHEDKLAAVTNRLVFITVTRHLHQPK